MCMCVSEWGQGWKAYPESLIEHYGRPRHTRSVCEKTKQNLYKTISNKYTHTLVCVTLTLSPGAA